MTCRSIAPSLRPRRLPGFFVMMPQRAAERFIAGYDPDLRARAGLPGTMRLAASSLGRLFSRLDGDAAFDAATCTDLATLLRRLKALP